RDKAPYRYVGRFFYSWGEVAVDIPAGPVRVEVWKGLEYRPQALTTRVGPGTTRRVEIPLTRAVPMAQLGYYPGDPHLHIPRQTPRDEETTLDLLAAEDIRYGAILGFNEPAGPYAGFMGKMHAPQRGLGARSARSRGDYSILSGQEYRSNTYGHLL